MASDERMRTTMNNFQFDTLAKTVAFSSRRRLLATAGTLLLTLFFADIDAARTLGKRRKHAGHGRNTAHHHAQASGKKKRKKKKPARAPTPTAPPTVPACVPACTGRVCGDDGCGGSCGTCP